MIKSSFFVLSSPKNTCDHASALLSKASCSDGHSELSQREQPLNDTVHRVYQELHKSPGVDRKRQDIEDGLHQYKRQQSLGSWISSDHCSLCIAKQPPPLPKSLACLFSLSHSLFSFCPTLCHFYSTIIFCRFPKITSGGWGMGMITNTPVGKHVSVQTEFWNTA